MHPNINLYIAKTLNFHISTCVRIVRVCETMRRKSNIKGPVVIDVMPLKTVTTSIERKIFLPF